MKRELWPSIKRSFYFAKYNLMPFRWSMVTSHAFRRTKSKLKLKSGYRIIDLSLTYDCNLKCSHCSAFTLKKKSPQLGLEDYRAIVGEAENLDNLSWNITGGEPLLVDWIDELIPILNPEKHYISVQTNAILLDEYRAKKLSNLGVNCITTSIDSIDPFEHNNFRGMPEAYEKTFIGLENARNAGMQILIGGIVTHQNLRSKKLIDLIEKANEVGAIFLFNLAVPCGKWSGANDMILRGDDRDYLIGLMNKYPKSTTDHEVGRNAVGCPAGIEKCYITPYGNVLPCPFIHISFGNVTKEPLSGIVKRMQRFAHFNHYQDICIAAEDREFHKNVFSKIYEAEQRLPVDYKEIYGVLDGK
jgi:MoaA/NifB/PqqE/SkfB family radical SAM enzyme